MNNDVNRRQFLRRATDAIACAIAGGGVIRWGRAAALPASPASQAAPVMEIGTGPQLFLDDYFIDRLEGLKRQVHSPRRLEKPVLDSPTFGTSQPYVTVLRDAQRDHFRIWYNRGAAVWHAESEDAIHWKNPRPVWPCSHCFV